MNNELSGNIMIMFVGLKAKTCSFLIDDGSEDEKAKGTIKFITKKNNFNLKNYKNCLEATQLDNKIKYIEKNKISIDSFGKNP